MTDWVIAGAAFVVTVLVMPVVIVIARRTGVVDHPGALKHQSVPVPYLGGVAVLAGAAVGAIAGRPEVLVPLGAATVLGVADDRFDLPPLIRLCGQLAIGAMVVMVSPVHLPTTLVVPLLLAITVVLINGANLLDGLDMLAAGVCAVAAAGFAVLLGGSGRDLAVALALALLGFLLYNRPPARVYLGDGGSYLLGTALTVLLAMTWAPGVATHTGVAALALVALPAAEVACTVVRRLRAGRSVLAGDRGHLYDLLVARGWTPVVASLAYIGAGIILSAAAVGVAQVSSVAAALVLDAAAAVGLMTAAAATGALGLR